MLKILLIGWISTSICLGADVVSLKAKDIVPFDGILFSLPKAEDTRIKLLERDSFQKMNQVYINSQADYDAIQLKLRTNLDLCIKETDNVAQNLYAERQMRNVERIAIFGGGIATTIIIFYIVKAVVNTH